MNEFDFLHRIANRIFRSVSMKDIDALTSPGCKVHLLAEGSNWLALIQADGTEQIVGAGSCCECICSSAFDRLQSKCPNLILSSDTELSMLWARIDDLPSYWRTSGASRALRSLQKAVWASSKR